MEEFVGTHAFNHVEQFLNESLTNLQRNFDRCAIELQHQATACPASIDLFVVEDRLKEFVRLHHLDFNRRIHYQLNHFHGQIQEEVLFQALSSMNDEQVKEVFASHDSMHHSFSSLSDLL